MGCSNSTKTQSEHHMETETQLEGDVFKCQFFLCFKNQYDYCNSCKKSFCEEHVIEHGKCTPLSSYGNGVNKPEGIVFNGNYETIHNNHDNNDNIIDSDNNHDDHIFIDSDKKHNVIDDDNKDVLSDHKNDSDEKNKVLSDKDKCMFFKNNN